MVRIRAVARHRLRSKVVFLDRMESDEIYWAIGTILKSDNGRRNRLAAGCYHCAPRREHKDDWKAIMKLYVLGDSISIQYGPYLQTYLTGRMEYSRKEAEEEALLKLDNPQGNNGGDSGMVLAFLKAKAASGGLDADLLLLNCGLHDIKTDPGTGRRQVSIDRYAGNLEAIIQTVNEMQCALAWVRTTPCDERVHNYPGIDFHRFSADCEAYNRVADQVMQNAGVPMIDLYAFTLNLGTDLYCDHVHFRDDVREKQAAFIAGWLMAFTGRRSKQA